MDQKVHLIWSLYHGKSLFEVLCDSLKEEGEKYGVVIPWYIMTSKENNDDTIAFFQNHQYFAYPKEDIFFFIQGELPMIDINGKILLDTNGMPKLAADGHGGVFESLLKNNAIADMKKRGIEWIFIAGVDNPLVKMVDPIFIGVAEENKHLGGSKTIVKSNPKEKVGAFCKKDGRPYVIEYTELPDELAAAKDENGEYLYGEGHMLFNMFNIKVIEDLGKNKLPYHPAFKKAEYLDESGKTVTPEGPNAYKFEAFIFDVFPMLDEVTLLRVKREEEFAPIKSLTGEDSAESAKVLYENYMKNKKK